MKTITIKTTDINKEIIRQAAEKYELPFKTYVEIMLVHVSTKILEDVEVPDA